MPSRCLFATLVLSMLSGCWLIAETDGLVEDRSCDLELDLRSFAPHLNQGVEVRLTQDPPDGEGGAPRLLLLGTFDPLTVLNVDMQIPGAVPALVRPDQDRPQIDFFADFNGDQVYSSPPQDHTWTVEDPCEPGRDPTFVHNFDFVELETPMGLGSTLHVDFCDNLTSDDRFDLIESLNGTEPIEIRVTLITDPTPGAVEQALPVAFYRLGALERRSSGIRIPAMFDNGFRYQIEIYADANDNFRFDPGEPSWTYLYRFADSPACEAPTLACGVSLTEVLACKDGNDLRVRVSRAHRTNVAGLSGPDWLSVPEGS